ncbi:MAG: hypothetical protein Kow0047_15600 [Anaerolineae bacterium]
MICHVSDIISSPRSVLMKVQRTFVHHKIALMAATEQGMVISYIRYRGALHLTRDTNTFEGDDQPWDGSQTR